MSLKEEHVKELLKARIATPADYRTVPMESGDLTWLVSREIGNSGALTVGRSIIHGGMANPRHYHPNCEEVLHVLKGRIIHTVGERSVELEEGDTITIPAQVVHNARNPEETDAVLLICFSSADRETVWVP